MLSPYRWPLEHEQPVARCADKVRALLDPPHTAEVLGEGELPRVPGHQGGTRLLVCSGEVKGGRGGGEMS